MGWDEISTLESNILLSYFNLYLTNTQRWKTFRFLELPAVRLQYFWSAGVAFENTYALLLQWAKMMLKDEEFELQEIATRVHYGQKSV